MRHSEADPLLLAAIWLVAIMAGAIILFWVAIVAGVITLVVGLVIWFLWAFGIWKKKTEAERGLEETRQLYREVLALSKSFERPDQEQFEQLVIDGIRDRHGTEQLPNFESFKTMMVLAGVLYMEEGFGEPPEITFNRLLGLEEGVRIRNRLRQLKKLYGDGDHNYALLCEALNLCFDSVTLAMPDVAKKDLQELAATTPGDASNETFSIPLVELMDARETVFKIQGSFLSAELREAEVLEPLRETLIDNICEQSGIPVEDKYTSKRKQIWPEDAKGTPEEIVHNYLKGTPLVRLFWGSVPFEIPEEARFEHSMIVGGSGHGKTQLLQLLIKQDLEKAVEDGRSVIVIDSQGDLIDNIVHMPLFKQGGPLADRLLLVDPWDAAEWPVCLNMFDINRERLAQYKPIEQEMILNGTIDLYSYLFGALLGADLTQKQGVIFRYIARLMLAIPDANIQTLREVMEDGEPFRPYMEKLDGPSRAFFKTQFFDKSFADTKKQVLRRLWGVLANQTFECMFSNKRNKVDMFDAMGNGKIVLINTAQDLLKTEGCQIFGRFFIAMTAQAALQRSTMPKSERLPAFVYIDEASQYIDDNVEDLLNQARKYRVGLTLAFQNLDQLSVTQRSTFMSSTSIKLAGGVSNKDARQFAAEMRVDPEMVFSTKKSDAYTEFACYVRNTTPRAMRVQVPFGRMESLGRIVKNDYYALIAKNRTGYAVSVLDLKQEEAVQQSQDSPEPGRPTADAFGHTPAEFELGEHEKL